MKAAEEITPVTLDYASARRGERRPLSMILGVMVAVALFLTAGTMVFFGTPLICGRHTHGTNLNRGKLGAMQTPLELYRQHVGAYPASLNDLITAPAGTDGQRWRGPYVRDLNALMDAWDRPFRYKAPGVKNPKEYDLWSAGRDGVSGTKDDICNWR